MQSRDLRQLLDAAAANLRGKQASEKPSHPFVCRGEQTIDGSMFASNRTTRPLPTNRTFTAMNRSSMSNHMN